MPDEHKGQCSFNKIFNFIIKFEKFLSISRQQTGSLKEDIRLASEAFPELKSKEDWAKRYHVGSRKMVKTNRGRGVLTSYTDTQKMSVVMLYKLISLEEKEKQFTKQPGRNEILRRVEQLILKEKVTKSFALNLSLGTVKRWLGPNTFANIMKNASDSYAKW